MKCLQGAFRAGLRGIVAIVALSALPCAQAQGPADAVLTITDAPPRAFTGQMYSFQFNATGGVPPYKWSVVNGTLPPGLSLSQAGILAGNPQVSGDFSFTVAVTDSAHPANQRNKDLAIRCLAPLLADWALEPRVVGQRIEGTVKISNNTDRDFDLTVIVLAINEFNRATAIGYQHLTLKKNTQELEIQFGETVARGSYLVNLDAVGEVKAVNSIYRARLTSRSRLVIP